MPFKSKSEQGYLYANKPDVAEQMAKDTPKSAYKNLPQYVSDKKKAPAKKKGK